MTCFSSVLGEDSNCCKQPIVFLRVLKLVDLKGSILIDLKVSPYFLVPLKFTGVLDLIFSITEENNNNLVKLEKRVAILFFIKGFLKNKVL